MYHWIWIVLCLYIIQSCTLRAAIEKKPGYWIYTMLRNSFSECSDTTSIDVASNPIINLKIWLKKNFVIKRHDLLYYNRTFKLTSLIYHCFVKNLSQRTENCISVVNVGCLVPILTNNITFLKWNFFLAL